MDRGQKPHWLASLIGMLVLSCVGDMVIHMQ